VARIPVTLLSGLQGTTNPAAPNGGRSTAAPANMYQPPATTRQQLPSRAGNDIQRVARQTSAPIKATPWSDGNLASSIAFPGALAGTVTLTNGMPTLTFAAAQTLPGGTLLSFALQPGVVYQLQSGISASTSGTLTGNYTGTNGTSATYRLVAVRHALTDKTTNRPRAFQGAWLMNPSSGLLTYGVLRNMLLQLDTVQVLIATGTAVTADVWAY
jgi:hypothetical protein